MADAWPARREDIEALIPHRGTMCLLDRVLHFADDALHAQSDRHRDPDHPLRRDDCLAALHLCEYGAQAMAVHGGLLARARGTEAAPGLLVSLRAVELHVVRIDDLPGPLDVHVDELADSGAGWQSRFRILHQGRQLAHGRCAVLKWQQGTPA
ncbi:MAG: phosphotransferase [Xanthomonadales bacterium]|nr:phosphotransferase [Xanthomonadales bacterium]